MFEQGRAFVEAFGASIGAHTIDPMADPQQYAAAMRRIDPRNQGPNGVFAAPENAGAGAFADRYVVADNGLPRWAAEKVSVMYDAADRLGIRRKETGATFKYDYPEGEFDAAIVIEGANKTSEARTRGVVAAIQAGGLVVPTVVVTSSGRKVGEREGFGPTVTTGHEVGKLAAKAVRAEYPDLFAKGNGMTLVLKELRALRPTAYDTIVGAVTALDERRGQRSKPIRSVVVSGSNIYPWMMTDAAAAAHFLQLEDVGFGAPADNPKAARTDGVWLAEVTKLLASAASLQDLINTRKPY